jgi:4-amino-4-deoxychorismate lyase
MWWVNGTLQSAAEGLDRGLEFGDGLFETMALVGGRIRLLERHLTRLEAGCARLQLLCPDRSLLLSDLSVAAATPGAGLIKLIVTRGQGGTGYRYPASQGVCRYVTAQPQRARPAHYVTDGIRAQWVSVRHGSQPLLAGLKHLNRLEQVLARAQVSEDVAEGLMLDQTGHLISGTMTNVFMVIDNRLVTPALVHCGVAGAMRAALVDAWQAAGHAVEVRTVQPSELSVASEVFVCNALIGVWPITRLDASHWSVGPYTRQAQAWIAQW